MADFYRRYNFRWTHTAVRAEAAVGFFGRFAHRNREPDRRPTTKTTGRRAYSSAVWHCWPARRYNSDRAAVTFVFRLFRKTSIGGAGNMRINPTGSSFRGSFFRHLKTVCLERGTPHVVRSSGPEETFSLSSSSRREESDRNTTDRIAVRRPYVTSYRPCTAYRTELSILTLWRGIDDACHSTPFRRQRTVGRGRVPSPPSPPSPAAARKVNAHIHSRPSSSLSLVSSHLTVYAYGYCCFLVARRRRRCRKWNFRRAHHTNLPSGTDKRFENNSSRWMVSIFSTVHTPVPSPGTRTRETPVSG